MSKKIAQEFGIAGVVGFLAMLVPVSPAASAAVRSVPAAADNTLFEEPSGLLSNGAGPHVYVGRTRFGDRRRAVMRFDLAPAVPVGSTINSAELRLNLSNPLLGPYGQVGVHRATASWGEGASNASSPGGGGAPSTTGDATWVHRFFNSSLWTTPGGDFNATASAAFTPVDAGPVSTGVQPGLAGDVQSWLDTPSGNFGWLLRLTDEGPTSSAVRFDSRENATASNQPALVVNFRVGGDATADDKVDIADFSLLATAFNTSTTSGPDGADFNRDGSVDIGDFSILAGNFNLDLSGPGFGSRAVPEPAALLTGCVAGLVLFRRRR